ncbi:MAG: hypothetical protein ACE5HZ_07960, partial [Fidelibacterota bacterium]
MKYLLLLVAIFHFPMMQAEGQDAFDLLQEGKEWLEKGELDSAEKKLVQTVEINPTLAEAYHLLGQVYLRQYDLDKTRENLLMAIEIDGHNQEYRDTYERVRNIASLMAGAKRSLEGGDPYIAIGKYESVMKEFPEMSALVLYHMGLASMRADNITEAAGYFREAMTFDPGYDKPVRAMEGIANKLFNDGNQDFLRGDYE